MAINWTVSRRTALKGFGCGAVALPAFLKGEAQAEGGRVVVGRGRTTPAARPRTSRHAAQAEGLLRWRRSGRRCPAAPRWSPKSACPRHQRHPGPVRRHI